MAKVTYANRADFNQFTEYVLSDSRIVRKIESAGGIVKYVVMGTCENTQSYMDEIGDWIEIDDEELSVLLESIGDGEIAIATETDLNAVMTATETQETYGLSESTVRSACQRGTIPARKSAGTWLILRKDAETRWSTVGSQTSTTKKLLQAEQPAQAGGIDRKGALR